MLYAPSMSIHLPQAKAAGFGKRSVCLGNIVLLVLRSAYSRQSWAYCILCPELVHAVSLSLKTSSPCWCDAETDPKSPTSSVTGSCWLSILSGLRSIHTRWFRQGGACCPRGIRAVCEFWAEMETTLATLSEHFPTSQLSWYVTWRNLIPFLSTKYYIGSPYFLMWGQLPEMYQLQNCLKTHESSSASSFCSGAYFFMYGSCYVSICVESWNFSCACVWFNSLKPVRHCRESSLSLK